MMFAAIAMWSGLTLSVQVAPSPFASADLRGQVGACLQHQDRLVGLLDMLDQPGSDVDSASTARRLQSDCAAAATLVHGEATVPCARFLERHAEVAGGMADIFEGRRPREDVPGFIYPGWQEGAAQCYRITGYEAPQ